MVASRCCLLTTDSSSQECDPEWCEGCRTEGLLWAVPRLRRQLADEGFAGRLPHTLAHAVKHLQHGRERSICVSKESTVPFPLLKLLWLVAEHHTGTKMKLLTTLAVNTGSVQ